MEPSSSYKYDVFISYSRKDYQKDNPEHLTNKIIKLFEDNNISYFFDQSEIIPGDAYAALITDAILDSKIFLFISTENANSSQWTKKEISLAIHYEKKIIPVRADMSHYNSSVAFYLADIDYIDGRDHDQTIERLTLSIVNPIKKEAEAKMLEAKKKKEKELKEKAKKEKEQEQLAASIRLDIAQLDSDEKSLDIKREKITLQICKIENEAKRAELSALLSQTGTIYNALQSQIEDLKKIIKERESQINNTAKVNAANQEETTQEIEKYKKLVKEYKALIAEKETNKKRTEDHKTKNIPESENRLLKCYKEHSAMTMIIACLSALAIVGISIFSWKELQEHPESHYWSVCLIICGIMGAYILSMMLRKYRVHPSIHIAFILLLGALTYWEFYLVNDFLAFVWPTKYIQDDIVKYVPIPILLAMSYLIGLSSFLIKNRKTGMNSYQNLKCESFIDLINPKKHIGTIAIIAAFIILMLV